MPKQLKNQTQRDPEYQRSVDAIAAFAALVHGRLRHDYPAAGDAQRDLEKMGIAVKFRRRPRTGKGAAHGE